MYFLVTVRKLNVTDRQTAWCEIKMCANDEMYVILNQQIKPEKSFISKFSDKSTYIFNTSFLIHTKYRESVWAIQAV